MTKALSKPEVVLLLAVIAAFIWIRDWQHDRLQAIQRQHKQVHYAVRLRAAQAILETEMLRGAYLMASDGRTRHLARRYLKREIE